MSKTNLVTRLWSSHAWASWPNFRRLASLSRQTVRSTFSTPSLSLEHWSTRTLKFASKAKPFSKSCIKRSQTILGNNSNTWKRSWPMRASLKFLQRSLTLKLSWKAVRSGWSNFSFPMPRNAYKLSWKSRKLWISSWIARRQEKWSSRYRRWSSSSSKMTTLRSTWSHWTFWNSWWEVSLSTWAVWTLIWCSDSLWVSSCRKGTKATSEWDWLPIKLLFISLSIRVLERCQSQKNSWRTLIDWTGLLSSKFLDRMMSLNTIKDRPWSKFTTYSRWFYSNSALFCVTNKTSSRSV